MIGEVLKLFIAVRSDSTSVGLQMDGEAPGAVFEQEVVADLCAKTQAQSARMGQLQARCLTGHLSPDRPADGIGHHAQGEDAC